ncbi:MAG: 4-(cytidine 5'-diphospho)-2-C-methyl-D-erythritol kinase [bacterium]
MNAGGARAVEVAAQAKVNLRLHILAREATGFHQLETLFLRLELADTIRIRRTSGERSIDVTGDGDLSNIGPPERNLAWRAAEMYFDASEMRGGFAIEITKRIPIGGGLGGGSADAGAVLRALDAMSDYPDGAPRLMWLAAQLGADVPFLTSEHAYALAWGRGERMLALDPPPSRQVLLVVPQFSVNTASAYEWLAAWRTAHEGGRRDPLALDREALSDWDRLAPLARNDFEWMMTERYPEIAEHVAMLSSLGCKVSMMSGSGSTVFGVGVPENLDLADALFGPENERPRYILTQTASRVEPVSVIE